jgi:hypothetical protein
LAPSHAEHPAYNNKFWLLVLLMGQERCAVLCCRFVEQEVERVKVLFDQKEGRLRSERDAAQRQLQHLQAAQEDWEAQVCFAH